VPKIGDRAQKQQKKRRQQANIGRLSLFTTPQAHNTPPQRPINRFLEVPSFTLVKATGLTKISDGGGVEGEAIVPHRVALSALADFIATKRHEGCAIDVRLLLLLAPHLFA
jgi:hypothetical protein